MNEILLALFIDGFFLSLALSLFLVLHRLKEGPSLADRVVALDLFSTILLSAVAVTSIFVDEVIYFDVALILALFNFLSTAIFAYFIQNQEKANA